MLKGDKSEANQGNKEEWAGKIEEKIEKISDAHTKSQLQDALQTILKGPPGKQQKVESIELSEGMVNATIEKLEQKIQRSNKEKENLLKNYLEATNLLAEKQKEIDELEGEADKLADKVQKVASQRDAAKAQVEDLKIKLSQKEAESSALAVELDRKTKELEEANRRVAILEKENALFRKLLNMSAEEGIEGRIKMLKINTYSEENN
jgi:chromosome segregation ATPase